MEFSADHVTLFWEPDVAPQAESNTALAAEDPGQTAPIQCRDSFWGVMRWEANIVIEAENTIRCKNPRIQEEIGPWADTNLVVTVD